MRMQSGMYASLLLVVPCLGSAACQDTEGDDGDDRVPYAVELRIRFAEHLFVSDSNPHAPFLPLDEGYIVVVDNVADAPAQWVASRSTVEGARDSIPVRILHGPILVHPNAESIVLQQIRLPAKVCGTATVLPGRKMFFDRPYAVSSQCVAIPPSYNIVSLQQAAEELPSDTRFYPNIVDIEIDTPVSKAIIGNFDGFPGAYMDVYSSPSGR